ncbi:MAG: hypothetical protein Q8L71_07940 [Thiobacillus sp.]|nr:hypothetical protein [Thiobacillus sp.]
MDFVQKLGTIILGTLLLVFSVAFVSVPYTLGGHPGEASASAVATYHLS